MKRVYDEEARQAIEKALRRAIKLVKEGRINSASDLGLIAGELDGLALAIAENSDENVDDASISFMESCLTGDLGLIGGTK